MTERGEQLSIHDQALNLTKQILKDPAKVEVLKVGVGKYTRNVDVEFRSIDDVANADSTRVFAENRGVGYMLWGALAGELQRGKILKVEEISDEQLSDMIYHAYSRSGASGY